MFGPIVGAGAQALVVAVSDTSMFSSFISPDIPAVHKAQIENRGLVAKIMRSAPWERWFAEHGRRDAADFVTLQQQLRTVAESDLEPVGRCAKRVASLRSHFVVPYIHVATMPSEVRILMPKYSMTLQQWSREYYHLLSEAMLIRIANQVTLGLVDLHDEGIFHLDFHGGNVFVANSRSLEPHCLVADLEASYYEGISGAVSSAFTEPFAAPERASVAQTVARGLTPQELDNVLGKCDVWSLGLLLYSIAANHDFPGLAEHTDDLGTILMNHRRLTPTRIAAIVRRDLTTTRMAKGLPPFSDGIISLVTMMLNHDASTRPTMYMVFDALQKLQEGIEFGSSAPTAEALSFPWSLGPYELVQLPDSATLAMDLYRQSAMYDFHTTCARCGVRRSSSKTLRSECIDGSLHVPSHMSPWWGGSDMLLPGLPCESPMQVMHFLYPLLTDPIVSGVLAKSFKVGAVGGASPSEQLLQVQGGFVVVDRTADAVAAGTAASSGATKPLRVFAITPTQCAAEMRHPLQRPLPLHFGAAQPWPSACNEVLRAQGRIHSSVPSLLGTDAAKCFAWILPNETFILPNEEVWHPAPHGALVFWFEVDAARPHAMDRYFPLCFPAAASSGTIQSLADAGRAGLLPSAMEAIASGARAVVSRFHSAATAARPSGGAFSAIPAPPPVSTGQNAAPAAGTAGGDPPVLVTPGEYPLFDRTPAGRLFFRDLDAVTPQHNGGVNGRFLDESNIREPPNLPRAVSTTPLLVRHVAGTNTTILSSSIAPLQQPPPANTLSTVPPLREEVPQTLQPVFQATLFSSRDSSLSRPSTHAQTAGNSVQTSLQVSREPTVDRAADRGLTNTASAHYPESVLPPASNSSRQPALPSRSASSAETGEDGMITRAASLLSHHGTRDGGAPFLPPARFDAAASLLVEESSAAAVQQGTAYSHPPAVAAFPFRYESSHRETPLQLSPSRGSSTANDAVSHHHNIHSSVFDHYQFPHTGGTVHQQQHSFSMSANVGPPSRPPALHAAVLHPFSKVTMLPLGINGQRFRIVPTNEYGSCGPPVSCASVPLLCDRLGISSSRHRDVRFVCFAAADSSAAATADTERLSTLGPGGAFAAAQYVATERYLQHHGLLLLNDAHQAVGLVIFKLVPGAQYQPCIAPFVDVPLRFRGYLPATVISRVFPHAVVSMVCDPFSNGVCGNASLVMNASASTVATRGGDLSLSRSSTANAADQSLTLQHAPHEAELAPRSSFLCLGGPSDRDTAAIGEITVMAVDVHRGMFYFSDLLRQVWMELCAV